MTLRRKKPLQAKTPLKRTAFKRKPPKSQSDFDDLAKMLLLARSGGKCEVRIDGCREWGEHFHHILRRSQGGPGTADNGLHVCRNCHRWIHDHPAHSEEHGWLRRSTSAG